MAGDSDADVGLEILRSLVDQEVARAERSAARARQAFTVAAAFYAVVQTVIFGTFASRLISADERTWMLRSAALGGTFLAICGIHLLFADRNFKSRNLSSDNVLDAVNEATPATERFVELYARALDTMRSANETRTKIVTSAQVFALLTIAAVLVELVYGLSTRLG